MIDLYVGLILITASIPIVAWVLVRKLQWEHLPLLLIVLSCVFFSGVFALCRQFVSPSKPAMSEQTRYYTLGEELLAGPDGALNNYLGEGWSGPEPTHIWNDGPKAILKVPIKPVDSDLKLAVRCTPFVVPDRLAAQRVNVMVGGQLVGRWTVDREGEYDCLIPRSEIKDDTVQVSFEYMDAVSPKALGISEDDRRLGLAVHSIRITEITP